MSKKMQEYIIDTSRVVSQVRSRSYIMNNSQYGEEITWADWCKEFVKEINRENINDASVHNYDDGTCAVIRTGKINKNALYHSWRKEAGMRK